MADGAKIDPTALSYWFPKLRDAGLPVPLTEILHMKSEAAEFVWAVQDGKATDAQHKEFQEFAATIRAAGESVGWPCFLRTDHTSNKHSWKETCFLPKDADVGRHVYALAEFSECATLFGMPYTTWAVREYLPIKPVGICPTYSDMPICREFRFFVRDGQIGCWHPYWPQHALDQGGVKDAAALMPLLAKESLSGQDEEEVMELARAAGRALPGFWSVDILDTERGWFVTDMAEGDKSFHWEGCDADR